MLVEKFDQFSKDRLCRVIVVDDHAPLRWATCRLIELEGFDVRGAASGEAALNALKRSPADLLVTDIVMPGYHGLALARRAAMIQPSVRLLFMSAYTNGCFADAGITPAVELPDDHFLLKPFSKAQLLERIEGVLHAPAGLHWDGPARIERAAHVDALDDDFGRLA